MVAVQPWIDPSTARSGSNFGCREAHYRCAATSGSATSMSFLGERIGCMEILKMPSPKWCDRVRLPETLTDHWGLLSISLPPRLTNVCARPPSQNSY